MLHPSSPGHGLDQERLSKYREATDVLRFLLRTFQEHA